jgi:hypothetical protein
MDTPYTETETRQVGDFDQVSIRGNTCNAQLFISQGEQERLAIEAPSEYLHRLRSEVKHGKLTVRLQGNWLQELEDALATCLNRPHIVIRLQVRRLISLEVQCASIVHAPRIETPHLQVKLSGTGDFKLDWLEAERLEIHHSGSGLMLIKGQVEEQIIVLSGVGRYIAAGLESQRAQVRISGAGSARIQVSQALDASLRGVGILEYSGGAMVCEQVSGMGQVVHIENTKARPIDRVSA